MGLFKNDIGRPSNDTLRKRRIIYLIIILVAVAGIGICVSYTVNYFKNSSVEGASKNVSASEAKVTMAGNNGGFIMGNRYFGKGNYISLGSSILISTTKDAVGSNVVYTASDGKTKLTFKGTFGKDITRHVGNIYSKLAVQTLDSNNKSIATKSVNIKSGTATVTIAIPKNAYTVKVSVAQVTSNSVKQIFTKTINVATLPTITPSFIDSVSKTSAGLYAVQKNGNNKIKYNLTNSSGRTMYYSVFTYNSHTLTTDNVDSTKATCVAFNKAVTTPNYTVKVKSEVAIRLRVYGDLSTCRADTKARYASPGTSRYVISESTVKYQPKYTNTNDLGYTVISPHYVKEIGTKIGHQAPKACKEYAFRYAVYIMKGSVSKSTGNYYVNYGATELKYSNQSELFNTIKTKIDQGIPVVIHTSNKASDTHWVTVIGYKLNSTLKVDFYSLWIIDPWNNDNYYLKAENAVFFGPSRETITTVNSKTKKTTTTYKVRTTMVGGLHSDRVYYTWASRASAK